MALTIDGDDAITYLDDHYVCVRADGYEYTGGAHGTPFRQYFVFDRETGARDYFYLFRDSYGGYMVPKKGIGAGMLRAGP